MKKPQIKLIIVAIVLYNILQFIWLLLVHLSRIQSCVKFDCQLKRNLAVFIRPYSDDTYGMLIRIQTSWEKHETLCQLEEMASIDS